MLQSDSHDVGRPPRSLLVAAACLGLAALTLLLPWDLSFDPWGWALWGRELTSAVPFSTSLYPSWKPLPVAFDALFAPAGNAGPELWLLIARAGAIAALVLAYRLGSRLGGRVGGAVAVAGLVLMPEWLRHFAGGASEPLLVALVLGAIDRHLDGRRGHALALVFAAALLRPEAWPFLALYGVVWAWRKPRRLAIVAGLALGLGVAWFVPEWIGAGNPFYGSLLARESLEARQTQALQSPALEALSRSLSLAMLPLSAAALFEVAMARRRRERVPLVLAAGALAWVAIVVAMTAQGYAGLGRFALPAGAVTCVLGGAGIARLRELAPAWRGALAVGAALLVCIPFATPRAERLDDATEVAARPDSLEDQFPGVIAALGGRSHVLACGRMTVDGPFRPALAWRLGVPVRRLALTRRPLLVIRLHRRVLQGFEGPQRLRRLAPVGRGRLIARRGGWDVMLTTRPTGCRSVPGRARRS